MSESQHTFKRFASIAPETELHKVGYRMAYGDDSPETVKRYLELIGVDSNPGIIQE